MNERDPRFWNTHDDALSDDDAPTTGIEKGPHMSFADWLRVQQQAHLAFGDRLALVTDWSAPTPDEDWDVSALVRHVIEEQQWVPLLLAGRTVGEARSRLEPLGDDLVGCGEIVRPSSRPPAAFIFPLRH